jgi:excisionase family DNA binding protein
MENVVFTQLSIPEFRRLIQQELQDFHKVQAAQIPTRRDEMPGPGEAFVSKKQAARLLSCSPSTIDNHARSGKLTRHYVGAKSVRFDRQQVLALAQKHTNLKSKNK